VSSPFATQPEEYALVTGSSLLSRSGVVEAHPQADDDAASITRAIDFEADQGQLASATLKV
jgi:hypothetical protein